MLADCLHGAQQRGLLVQGLPGVGAECRGDTEDDSRGILLQERRGSDVPGRVTPGLERGPQASGGEGRRVRLALDQLLAGELHDHLAVLVRVRHESIVLLRRDAGEGLEPVGVMGGAVLHGPILHGLGHHVRGRQGQLAPLIHDFPDFFIDALGQPFLHLAKGEYLAGENLFYLHYFTHFPSPFSPCPPSAASRESAT